MVRQLELEIEQHTRSLRSAARTCIDRSRKTTTERRRPTVTSDPRGRDPVEVNRPGIAGDLIT
jgi:hypothetical protein